MAYGEDIEYCESCGSILEMKNICQVCGELTPEGKLEEESEELEVCPSCLLNWDECDCDP